jgi:hypothetical protein
MTPEIIAVIIGFILTSIWGLFAWLLVDKDKKQQEQIELLFKRHDTTSSDLLNLRLLIAGSHYSKTELDIKFEKLEHAFRGGLNDIGLKVDRLTMTIKGEQR